MHFTMTKDKNLAKHNFALSRPEINKENQYQKVKNKKYRASTVKRIAA